MYADLTIIGLFVFLYSLIAGGMYFGLASNDEKVTGIDHSPGYLRAAAKMLAGN